VTLSGMGLGTGAIGLIPTFESIGLTAAFILFGLRMIQGLCLGGEYGGAITYVAEHVSDERRGYYTGWLQTSPTLGIVVSLVVIGEGMVWYIGHFWAMYFLHQDAKLVSLTTAWFVGAGLILGTRTLILFGWLSENIGRQSVILAGFLLAAVTYFLLYSWLGSV